MIEPNVVLLQFDPDLNAIGQNQSLRDGLSVALKIGETLWVANDETISMERPGTEFRKRVRSLERVGR
ncbi:MAG TPA: hypothetical protein PKD12_02285 [Nitrospira sp.]|nr:hypothetical protein [Nitrospira sp.]